MIRLETTVDYLLVFAFIQLFVAFVAFVIWSSEPEEDRKARAEAEKYLRNAEITINDITHLFQKVESGTTVVSIGVGKYYKVYFCDTANKTNKQQRALYNDLIKDTKNLVKEAIITAYEA